jgi:hypothetical protein
MIEFAAFSQREQLVVNLIVKRAGKLWEKLGGDPIDGLSLDMDLAAVHAKVPLRLDELLGADDFNFAHDIGGIMRHMDRTTGELADFFLPRFAKPASERVNAR